MPHLSRRRLQLWSAGVALVALILAGTSPGVAAVKKAPSAKKQAATAFKLLVRDTRKLPRKSISKAGRGRLLATAAVAKRLSRRSPCAAVRTMRAYRKQLRSVRQPRFKGRRQPTAAGPRERLQADALRAEVALMQLPRAKRCGGGKASKVASVSRKVLASNAKRLRMRLSLPAPTFAGHNAGGRSFVQMFMEGMGESGDVGKPGLPQSTRFFGVPNGANVTLQVNGTQGYDVHGVSLFPHQASAQDIKLPPGAPPESTFQDQPFSLNAKAYASNARFPARPAGATSLGSVRDMKLGGLDFAGGQYRPGSDTLHVFTSIDVTVRFGGDNKGNFGHADTFTNPWETFFTRNYAALLDNIGAVTGALGPGVRGIYCGAEMLIITSPALHPAADAFAAGKNLQGYSTRVAIAGSGPGEIGTTNTAIQTYIRSQLNGGCLIRPTYVVLLGNTAAVPTFLVPCGVGGNVADCNIASDLPYSLDGLSSDLFADVMLGRIPAIDLAGANATVSKILNYENTMPAPAGDDFYHHATVTGYFQPATHCVLDAGASGTPNCDGDHPPVTGHWEIDHANHQDTRGFTKTAEAVHNAMTFNSYAVDRLYTTDDASVIPETYYDGTPIPSYLRRPSFAWDAGTTEFLNAYNGGRFLILHRDHGWPDGWAEPTLHSGHVPSLSNGTKLPVVFGINCASAAFDTPAHPSFVELQIEKAGGGAVAGFGDTRNSPSFPNNHMTRGFFDALFPNLQPEFGSATPTRRLGDVLVRGKQFMATQEGLDWQGAGDTYVEHYLYHLLGDPSLQMWADEPKQFVPPRIDTRYLVATSPGDPPWRVGVRFPTGGGEPPAFNTVATLFSGGQPIGRAIVGRDGAASIVPDVNVDPRNLSVSFQQDGVLPAQDTVDNQPTSLTLDGPKALTYVNRAGTYGGSITPPFGGAAIRVVGNAVDANNGKHSFTETATTLPNGGYSVTHDFTIAETGMTWTVQAFFDGDATHPAAASPTMQTVVGSG